MDMASHDVQASNGMLDMSARNPEVLDVGAVMFTGTARRLLRVVCLADMARAAAGWHTSRSR